MTPAGFASWRPRPSCDSREKRRAVARGPSGQTRGMSIPVPPKLVERYAKVSDWGRKLPQLVVLGLTRIRDYAADAYDRNDGAIRGGMPAENKAAP